MQDDEKWFLLYNNVKKELQLTDNDAAKFMMDSDNEADDWFDTKYRDFIKESDNFFNSKEADLVVARELRKLYE